MYNIILAYIQCTLTYRVLRELKAHLDKLDHVAHGYILTQCCVFTDITECCLLLRAPMVPEEMWENREMLEEL